MDRRKIATGSFSKELTSAVTAAVDDDDGTIVLVPAADILGIPLL
jgi:hypothetical protein